LLKVLCKDSKKNVVSLDLLSQYDIEWVVIIFQFVLERIEIDELWKSRLKLNKKLNDSCIITTIIASYLLWGQGKDALKKLIGIEDL